MKNPTRLFQLHYKYGVIWFSDLLKLFSYAVNNICKYFPVDNASCWHYSVHIITLKKLWLNMWLSFCCLLVCLIPVLYISLYSYLIMLCFACVSLHSPNISMSFFSLFLMHSPHSKCLRLQVKRSCCFHVDFLFFPEFIFQSW